MRVGIDFDNTIISYDAVFGRVACEMGILPPPPPSSKKLTKSGILSLPRLPEDEREQLWMALQGQVYGAHIGSAAPYPDVLSVINTLSRKMGAELFIVSHKTEYGHYDDNRVNLREAALSWLISNGIAGHTDAPVARSDIFFCQTREDKLDRIRTLDLDVFIDDLAEVLTDPAFPERTHPIRFDPAHDGTGTLPFDVCREWSEVLPIIGAISGRGVPG